MSPACLTGIAAYRIWLFSLLPVKVNATEIPSGLMQHSVLLFTVRSKLIHKPCLLRSQPSLRD